jgi:murein L,D-transpeptidase YcbB/YkuD
MVWLFLVALLTFGPRAHAEDIYQRDACELACESLRNRIEAAGFPPALKVRGEMIYASEALPQFYERRAYRIAWSGNGGPLPQTDSLILAIRSAGAEGLNPQDYHLDKIEAAVRDMRRGRLLPGPIKPALLADLDMLLTDAFLTYGFHLLSGRLDPETIDPEWHIGRSEGDVVTILEGALSRNGVAPALRDLLPRHPCYRRLKGARRSYQRILSEGGWPVIADGPKMQIGSRGDRVTALRRRLEISGDLSPGTASEVFDDSLEAAVRRFQRRHGLDVDGVVGPMTLKALDVPAQERVRQIEVNMERWRWLPRALGERYLVINIANFELDVFEAGEKVIGMRVVVGRDYRRTPVFSDVMTYLVLNPYWNVPHRLAVEDKLPLIKQDPGYLASERIRVFQGWGADAVEIDPATVDWSKVTAGNFNYRLRQDPGPQNALGRIKFMFPNRFDVYLHDTPSRSLFDKSVRAFSSGCIRIENPIGLAEYLLRSDPKWARPAILVALGQEVEQTVRLPEPIPVHVLYCTAWVDDDGTVQFRDDIYGRDKAVDEALREGPPTS